MAATIVSQIDPGADATAPGIHNDFQFLVVGSFGSGAGRRPGMEAVDALNVYSSAYGDRQSVPFSPLPSGISRVVSGLVRGTLLSDVNGTTYFRFFCLSGGVYSYDPTEHLLTNAGVVYTSIPFSTDPATGLPWTRSGYEAAEFGVQNRGDGAGSDEDLVAIDHLERVTTVLRAAGGFAAFVV